MFTVRQFAVLVSAAGIGIGVAGCGNTVTASDIAQQAKTKFNQQFASQGSSKRVDSVSCPNDLQGKTGASEVCNAIGSPGHVRLYIKVTITSVSGNTAHFDDHLTVAPSPQSGTSTG